MSDTGHTHRSGLKESTSSARKPFGNQIIRKRVDGPLPAIPFSVSFDHPVAPTDRPFTSSVLVRNLVVGDSKQPRNERTDPPSNSVAEGNILNGKRVRTSSRPGDRPENPAQAETRTSHTVEFATTVHPRRSKETVVSSHLYTKSTRKSASKHSSRQESNLRESATTSSSKDKVQQPVPTQHIFTGPLAASEFERLRREVEALKEALHESKKTARRYLKKLDESKAELSTALTTIIEKDLELSSIKSKQIQSQEILSTVESTVQCQICFDLPDRPYALAPCGHVLCLSCLQEWFRSAPPTHDDFDDYDDPCDVLTRTKTCPACRATVRHRPIPIFMLKGVSAALRNANPSLSLLPGSRIAADTAEDPWEGIFPSSGEEDESERSYGTDEESVEEVLHGWYPMDDIADESDEGIEEEEDEDEESGEDEDGDSSSEEEWGPLVFNIPSRVLQRNSSYVNPM